MTAFTNHFLFEFKTGLRNSGAMMMNYLLPLGFYAAMGFVMVEINPGFKELLIPSMIVLPSPRPISSSELFTTTFSRYVAPDTRTTSPTPAVSTASWMRLKGSSMEPSPPSGALAFTYQ